MAHHIGRFGEIASHSLEPNAKTKMALDQQRRPCDAALSLAERIEINLAEALSRSSSIGTFWAISVRPPDPVRASFRWIEEWPRRETRRCCSGFRPTAIRENPSGRRTACLSFLADRLSPAGATRSRRDLADRDHAPERERRPDLSSGRNTERPTLKATATAVMLRRGYVICGRRFLCWLCGWGEVDAT